jgi:hypothetical protein
MERHYQTSLVKFGLRCMWDVTTKGPTGSTGTKIIYSASNTSNAIAGIYPARASPRVLTRSSPAHIRVAPPSRLRSRLAVIFAAASSTPRDPAAASPEISHRPIVVSTATPHRSTRPR